jgi:hypothetical protein
MPHITQSRSAPAPAQAPPANSELRNDIRSAIQDAQNAARDAQIAAQDAARASGANVGPVIAVPPVPPTPPMFPGAYGGDPFNNGDVIPPQVVDISIAFFIMCAVMVIGWPLARAFGKRIERRGEVAAINPAVAEQLQRIEQAVEAVSIEVERISESQRFMARLQNAQTPERIVQPADRS